MLTHRWHNLYKTNNMYELLINKYRKTIARFRHAQRTSENNNMRRFGLALSGPTRSPPNGTPNVFGLSLKSCWAGGCDGVVVKLGRMPIYATRRERLKFYERLKKMCNSCGLSVLCFSLPPHVRIYEMTYWFKMFVFLIVCVCVCLWGGQPPRQASEEPRPSPRGAGPLN